MGWVNGKAYGVPAVWHNGDDSRFGSLRVMSKRGWGMVLLLNSSNPLSELEPTQYIASGATRLLAGLDPEPTGMTTIRTTYLVVDGVLLALSVLILVSAARLPRWSRNLRQRHPARRPWRTSLTALRAAAEILFPFGILLLVPWRIGSWPLMIFGVPDLAWWLLGASTITVATGLTRGALLAREVVRGATYGHAAPPTTRP